MSQEDLAKLLQFCTGSSRTPVEGFRYNISLFITLNLTAGYDLPIYRALESNRGTNAKFCIESVPYNKVKQLITAHTCFNRLVLPMYPTKEALITNLQAIIQLDFNGVFGLE